ncbi:MAG: electron transfer flavoprotein subunit beta/FixA family protein [Ignavibacteria bacterium]|nr:electron transfer flavoprotein subunit beta/FixA family protein [Ignavibacteria bacterium]
MKVVVCISYIPDPNNEFILSPNRKFFLIDNLNFIINPFDEYAIEEAVQLKEKTGAETIVVCYGPPRYKEAIRKAYSFGIDKGVLIQSNLDNFDSFTVAKNLADFIQEIKPDLIFFGKQSIDFDGNSVHGMVAEIIGIPSINIAIKINYSNGQITVEREVEDGREILTLKLPAIIGTQKGINTPRYPKLKDVLASKTKSIEIRDECYSKNKIDIFEIKHSQTKAQGRILKENSESITELIKFLKDDIKIL